MRDEPAGETAIGRGPDHDDFGAGPEPWRFRFNELKRDTGREPVSTLIYPALGRA